MSHGPDRFDAPHNPRARAPRPGLRIGDWMVDPNLDEISKNGQVVKLEPRTMRLLLYLAANHDRVVGLQELLDEIWPSVIVTTQSVYSTIAQLRHTLGCSGDSPAYISTVPKKGYRLIADVNDQLGTSVSSAPATITKDTPSQNIAAAAELIPDGRPPRNTWSRTRRWAMGVGALVITIAAILVLMQLKRVAPQPSSHVEAKPVTVPEHSVAVLPFIDMSEKKDEGYFADGLSEELISVLSQTPDLRVPARTSSFYFKDKAPPIADIARALGVTYLLEGSVRKSGATLRITAQLVRADNGYHVWSESYDRPVEDIFSIQDDIAGAVAKALRVSLLGASPSRSITTANPEAYSLYLQGRLLEQRVAAGEYESAVTYLKKALALDPKFAAAWAELARTQIQFFRIFANRPVEEVRRESLAAAGRAVSLDPNLPEAHLAMGMLGIYVNWDWSAAESEFNRALELDPGSAEALLGLGKVAVITGRYEDGLQLLNSAIVRDPLNDGAYQWLAHVQSRRRQYAQAEAARRNAVQLNPAGGNVHQWLGYELLVQGKSAEALREFEKSEDPGVRRIGVMLALDALGRTREAEEVEAEEEERSANEMAANIAAFYACRKDGDRAFPWLDRGYRQRDDYLITFVGDFCFDKLKGDPRYAAFLRKMNLAGGSHDPSQ
jgi:TolB-like protein/DNA-binding winged helix-turn-helix (wHTH) protein/Tfp pilus assembly protein PilF